ncbi:MAG: hypothetical protein H0U77_02275 [Nocardioidaceae bacterium]|nr:hypothetical protein [Nocardioidaceae bacterium]
MHVGVATTGADRGRPGLVGDPVVASAEVCGVAAGLQVHGVTNGGADDAVVVRRGHETGDVAEPVGGAATHPDRSRIEVGPRRRGCPAPAVA